MQCWICGKTATGVCAFCGRGICKEHAKEKPSIISVYVGNHQTPKAIAVSKALYCGVCQPQAEPIDMPEIY